VNSVSTKFSEAFLPLDGIEMNQQMRDKIIHSSRKLKIAYIIGTYPEITTTFIDREIQALQAMGAQIQVVSIRRPAQFVSQLKEYAEIQKQIIYLLPPRWTQLFFAHMLFVLIFPWRYFSTLWFLLSRPHPKFLQRLKTLLHFGEGIMAAYRLRGGDWDHIHAHFIDRAATVALIVSRLLNTPYSITAHADDIYNEPVLVFEKISEARFAVTVSEFNRRHLAQTYPLLDSKKIIVLHPWIDTAAIRPRTVPVKNKLFRILSVGRLVENKGHQFLIEACDVLRQEGLEFECHIIGQGPLHSELHCLIERRGLQDRVHLLGEQPQTEVFHYLNQADVFVLACVIAANGKRDGMPVAIAEAMAMQVPVVSTSIAGLSEMVLPGTGYLVPPKDAFALAKAIRKIYEEGASSRIKMGEYGRTVIVQHFDLHQGIEKLASLFENSVPGSEILTMQERS